MPVSIRTLAPNISVASYRFPIDEYTATEHKWPWLQAPPGTDELCQTCSRLSFPWLFDHALSAYEVRDNGLVAKLSDGICLGLYSDISRRLNCNLCQLVVHAFEQGADIQMLNHYDEWPEQEVWMNNYFPSRYGFALIPVADIDGRITQLGFRFGSSSDENTFVGLGLRTITIHQVFKTPDTRARGQGRAIDTNIECMVRTIKDWVQPCSAHKASTTVMKRENDTKVRLIDTQNYSIAGPLRNERYVALSYTWGKIEPLVLLAQNEAELRRKDALLAHREQLPVTIQDAIRLCALLGERYLWVDSLCIMQDTPDKHTQIQQMDLIYQSAAFCIVAAAGRDGNAGLPGVSRLRATRQRIINLGYAWLANKIPPIDQSLAQTFWQSRGWCFQEDLLSVRKLVFTPDQMYYSCEHGACAENAHCTIHDAVGTSINEPPWLLSFAGRSNWEIYHLAVAQYSTRVLSFEEDVLNAFAGISAVLSARLFLGCPFVMGIPICSLEVGLMWHPFSRLKRRSVASVPSWSWAGWIGDVGYRLGVPGRDFDRTITQVEWHLETEDDLVTGIPSTSWKGWGGWQRVEDDKPDGFHYIHVESGSDRWFAHPIAQQQWSSAPHGSLLKCTADVAHMSLTREHTEFWNEEGECDEGHEICHLKIFDRQGHLAGVAVMDGATFDATFEDASSLQHTFVLIKISRTTLSAADDPAWDSETKRFAGRPGKPGINPESNTFSLEPEFDQDMYDPNVCWCMYNVLVVRFEGRVAYRVAVGRVYYTAFDNASPERRTFCLG